MLALATLATLLIQAPAAADQPGEIIRQVRTAMRTGTTATLQAEWGDRARRDPSDRVTAFRLAILANHLYDFDRGQGLSRR